MRSLRPLPKTLLLASLWVANAASAATPKYETLSETEFGKSFVAKRHDARSLTSALQLTLGDITRYFGATPSVYRAFADSKDQGAGGATFLVNGGGTPIKGLVTCQVGDKSTRVSVTFIRADAPAAEWGKLMRPAGATASAAASSPAASSATNDVAIAQGPLKTYTFPDGTGTVGLAEGWTTNARTAMGTTVLQGPKDQLISIGALFTVMTPQSTLPRGPGTLVAPFGTPAEVLETLMPQFNQFNARQGGATRTVDHLTKVSDQKPVLANGRMSVLRYGVTETTAEGASKHYQGMAWIELDPVSAISFMMGITQIRAPDATFEKDKPVLFQMLRSMKTNESLINRKSGEQLAAQKQRFNAQQAAHRAQQAANDAHNQQYWADQKTRDDSNRAYEDGQTARARQNDNFDEVIRGVRTVEDTQTGIKTSVDLGNVDKIVDDLNERDPGRYRQIPLRDESDPLRGQ